MSGIETALPLADVSESVSASVSLIGTVCAVPAACSVTVIGRMTRDVLPADVPLVTTVTVCPATSGPLVSST